MKTQALSVAAANLLLARMVMADLPAVTITTAPQSVQTGLASYIYNWDHHTLGVNVTVGGIISSVYAVSTANPTAANAILNVRSHLNFMEGPTPLFQDLEAPSSVVASISAQLPTTGPYPAALDLVSSIYGYLGSVASSQLNGQTTITAPPGWTPAPNTEAAAPESVPQTTSSAPVASSTMAVVTASECPAKTSGIAGTPQAQVVNGAIGVDIPTSLAVIAGVLGMGLLNLA